MNQQEIFDQVIEQMVKQGGPSIDTKQNKCVYHRADGRMCPGGVFLSPELVLNGFETAPFNFIAPRIHSVKTKLGGEWNMNLVKDLQDAHDESSRYTVEVARRAFTEVGKKYRLSLGAVASIKHWES